jgi:hypothetical protein
VRTHGAADGGITTADEGRDPSFEGRALDEDVTSTGLAAEPDVGAEAVDEPRVATAGMGTAEAQDVAEEQLDGCAGHRTRG